MQIEELDGWLAGDDEGRISAQADEGKADEERGSEVVTLATLEETFRAFFDPGPFDTLWRFLPIPVAAREVWEMEDLGRGLSEVETSG